MVTGMSVADVSQQAIANLGWTDIRMPAPVFNGDTLYAESEVLDKRGSRSRPTQGIVTIATRAYKADGTLVMEFKRTMLMPKRGHSIEDRSRRRNRSRGGDRPQRCAVRAELAAVSVSQGRPSALQSPCRGGGSRSRQPAARRGRGGRGQPRDFLAQARAGRFQMGVAFMEPHAAAGGNSPRLVEVGPGAVVPLGDPEICRPGQQAAAQKLNCARLAQAVDGLV